jgi:hypothetical protein
MLDVHAPEHTPRVRPTARRFAALPESRVSCKFEPLFPKTPFLRIPKKDGQSKLSTFVAVCLFVRSFMNISSVLRSIAAIVCLSLSIAGFSQDPPAVPPSHDPAFWGKANQPYTLKITHTSTSTDGNGMMRTRRQVLNVYRDSKGRVRTEAFYDNGQPMAVYIQDPIANTLTFMKVVGKTVYVTDLPRHGAPPPGKGWITEPLSSRVIDGISVDGVRYTRNVPVSDDGNGPIETIVEEDWLSSKLGVVLQQTDKSERIGTTTDTVSDFKQVEPDPTLFEVPSDYSPPPPAQPASR